MRSVLSILAGACCASLALAQPATGTRTTTTTTTYHRVSTVVGTSFSLGTESYGKVTDVVINDGGCIQYLIVQDNEGFVVVPWGVVTVNYDQKTVVVQSTSVTVDQLRQLRFTDGRAPNFADPTFTQRVQKVWGSASRSGSGGTRPGDRAGGTDRKDTGTPDRKGSDSATPDRKGSDRPTPDRKGSGTGAPDRADPPAKDSTSPARPKEPAKDAPPRKDVPKKDPKDRKDPDR